MNLNRLVIIVSLVNGMHCAQNAQQLDPEQTTKTSLSADIGKAAAVLSEIQLVRAAQPMRLRSRQTKNGKHEKKVDRQKNEQKVLERALSSEAVSLLFRLDWLKCTEHSCKQAASEYNNHNKSEHYEGTYSHIQHSALFCSQPVAHVNWQLLHALKIDFPYDFIDNLFGFPPTVKSIDFLESTGLVRIVLESTYNTCVHIYYIASKKLMYGGGIPNFSNRSEKFKTIDRASSTQKYRVLTKQPQKDWKPFEIHIYENKEWTEKKDEKN